MDDEDDAIHCWNRSDVTEAVRLGLVNRRTSSVTRCIRRTISGGAFSRSHFSMASVCPSNSWPIVSALKPISVVVDVSLELVPGEMSDGERRCGIGVVEFDFFVGLKAAALAASLTEKLMLSVSSPLAELHMFAEWGLVVLVRWNTYLCCGSVFNLHNFILSSVRAATAKLYFRANILRLF